MALRHTILRELIKKIHVMPHSIRQLASGLCFGAQTPKRGLERPASSRCVSGPRAPKRGLERPASSRCVSGPRPRNGGWNGQLRHVVFRAPLPRSGAGCAGVCLQDHSCARASHYEGPEAENLLLFTDVVEGGAHCAEAAGSRDDEQRPQGGVPACLLFANGLRSRLFDGPRGGFVEALGGCRFVVSTQIGRDDDESVLVPQWFQDGGRLLVSGVAHEEGDDRGRGKDRLQER